MDAVEWRIPKTVLLKNHFWVLDLLANFNWERPIYFAVTTGPDSYINLQEYFQPRGPHLPPGAHPHAQPESEHLRSCGHGRDVPQRDGEVPVGEHGDRGDIYLDENILRMTTNLRLQLSTLAEALMSTKGADEGREHPGPQHREDADRNVPFDRILLPTIEAYYPDREGRPRPTRSPSACSRSWRRLNYYISLEPSSQRRW